MKNNTILIFDFGSQYTQLIARRVRELNVYCEIVPCFTKLSEYSEASGLKGIILSGGPASVLDSDSPEFDQAWLEYAEEHKLPILGICYGMQYLAKVFNGEVAASQVREYGKAELNISGAGDTLFSEVSKISQVWMSHGDHVAELPQGFEVIATSDSIPFAAFVNQEKQVYGIQYHPEVVHSMEGKQMLANFLFKIAEVEADWNSENFITEAVQKIREQVDENSQVICGLSGGVDSSVAACLIEKAIPGKQKCIYVDTGLSRKDEAAEVEAWLGKEGIGLDLRVVDAKALFLGRLAGVTDPEKKRKIIGETFIEVFEAEANKISNVTHLVQGTLYPDIIESVSVRGPSATIKSHHNVGGLPEKMKLELIEPFRELFKDEVREIGRSLELPERIISRQPFPGPGMAVRVLGEVTAEQVHLVQEADFIIQEEVRKAGLYEQIWQSFAVLLPIRSVGVMGDDRTYDQAIAVRAVYSRDGMTADWCYLPQEVLEVISTRIINEVKGINRVVLDISNKPPATIEWE